MEKRIFGKGITGYLFLLPVAFLLILPADVQAALHLNSSFISGFVNDTTGQIVTGKVVDKRGKPLEGAVVLIKDRGIGCRTDFKGRFSIQANSHDILLFSYVGKEIRSIPVTRREIMKVRLHNAILVLEDSHPISCLKEDTEEVFEPIEVMPEFPGDLFQWVAEHIKYPEKAYEERITGEVQVSFVVDQKGEVKRVKVVQSVNALLDREAIRVVKSMPAWKPAKQNGKEVGIECLIPVSFLL
ncbi:energy transducer TonB [Gabonibacter chumensis]|uniref:energy transducer TonB n=1 Tax=Gabonibacter chumensis TaxID=2972474 RepID=UPI0025723428|nr:TonB family protein [Gabonibacter chumensis]MCR9011750.1 TonB family protein [Gabonibacter chumensis]